jgi:Galactose oxidase, central domain
MKKQLNPSVKAHLLRNACYLIPLVAVCVIPIALGQRATFKRSAVAAPLLLGSRPLATLSTGDGPASGTWIVTGSLNTARELHTATLLPNGTVLVAGGIDRNLNTLDSAELYDPASGIWTFTGSLSITLIVLAGTRVLLCEFPA